MAAREQEDDYTLAVVETASTEDEAFIQEALRAFNDEHSAQHRAVHQPENAPRPLNVLLRDRAGALVGGLLAFTYWGWLDIEKLWLDGRVRGLNYGTRMLLAAEAEAQRRGCRFSRLSTFSFQARGFYEKLGYRVVGQYDDYPPGGAEYWLRKDFDE